MNTRSQRKTNHSEKKGAGWLTSALHPVPSLAALVTNP